MRSGRSARGFGRRGVVACRAAVAGVEREADGAQLVPSAQREHRGRLPGAPRARQGRKPGGALLHERRTGPRALHALVGAPRLALGRLAPLGRLVGDPRLGMAGVFLSLRRVLPNQYPLDLDVESYIADEQRLGRLFDYAVIVPRLQRMYE